MISSSPNEKDLYQYILCFLRKRLMVALQLGHVCVTSLKSLMRQGIRQQPRSHLHQERQGPEEQGPRAQPPAGQQRWARRHPVGACTTYPMKQQKKPSTKFIRPIS